MDDDSSIRLFSSRSQRVKVRGRQASGLQPLQQKTQAQAIEGPVENRQNNRDGWEARKKFRKTEAYSLDSKRESDSTPSGEAADDSRGEPAGLFRDDGEESNFQSLGLSAWLCRWFFACP
jgi:hypothetical protein